MSCLLSSSLHIPTLQCRDNLIVFSFYYPQLVVPLKCCVVLKQVLCSVPLNQPLNHFAERELAPATTLSAKDLVCSQLECKEDCTVADPSACSQHTHMFNALSENLLHFILQGPHVGVRTVWLWQGEEQLMLPERYLKWRKWFSEILSMMFSLSTIQYSKGEFKRKCVIHRLMH